MSETKFTKGGWALGMGKTQSSVICSDKIIYVGDIGYKEKERKEEAIANAHLIAAAPEMYALLKSLLEKLYDEHEHISSNDIDKIEQLLTKARGES